MVRCLGIDPGGSGSHGYALLDVSRPMSPAWLEGGRTEDFGALLDVLEGVSLVAVERPVAMWKPEANVRVMATAWEGGDLARLAVERGYRVVTLSPSRWRTALVGKSRRGENVDAKVKRVLAMLVRGFPRRSSVHARDAAGVALVAARSGECAMATQWTKRPVG